MTREEIQAVVLETLKALGVADRQVSGREAERIYGRWFRDAVRRGDIKPARYGSRTRWYSVADILDYESKGRELARLQLSSITKTQSK